MGIQINGNTDTISAIDGSLNLTGAELPSVTNLNATGIVTASSFSGALTGNVNATGLSTFSGGLLVGTGASISSPASNTLTLGTNNTEKVRILSSGSVGIGTTNPDIEVLNGGPTLRVSGTGAGIVIYDTNSSGRYALLARTASQELFRIWDVQRSANRLVIDPNGSIGIGETISPSAKLQITSSSGGDTSGLRITRTDSGGGDWRIWSTADVNGEGAGKLIIGNSGNRVAIDGSGNFGIGTTNPSASNSKLDVQGTASFGIGQADSNNFNLRLRAGTSGLSRFIAADTSDAGYLDYDHSSDSWIFRTAGTEAFRINSSGNIGINSSNPAYKLDIIGGSSNQLQITGTEADIWLKSTGPGTIWRILGSTGGSTHRFRIYDQTNSTDRFYIAGSDGKMFSLPTYNNTTVNAANVFVNTDGAFYRSSSSLKYKTDVQTLQNEYADAILNIRPVWYRSKLEVDKPEWGYWGFIAEEVAKVDPRLVHWKTIEVIQDETGSASSVPCDPEPEGVQYDRFVPHLLNLIKRQQQAIETLQAEVAKLKSKVI